MEMLRGIGWFSRLTHVSAIHLIQMVLILCECLVAVLCFNILSKFFHVARPQRLLIPVLCVNPIAIFQVCQHGNFDVFVALWVMMMVYALLQWQVDKLPKYWLLACFCMGMGIFTKTIPVVLAPLLIPGWLLHKMSTRMVGVLLALAPVTISMWLLYMATPAGVREHVMGYRSMPGYYGITGIMGLMNANDAMITYLKISQWIILGYVGLIALIIKKFKGDEPGQIIVPILALLVFLPTFGPGYSPTYIYWFLPLLPIYYPIAPKRIRGFLLIGFLVVTLTYLYEYAIFNSHGAFLTKIITNQNFINRVENLGGRMSQVPARMPMFVFYVVLSVVLLRDMFHYTKVHEEV